MSVLVSIVIATRNRQGLLAQTLDALRRQTWPADRLEIVIADNGSTDGTAAMLAAVASRTAHPRFQVVSVDRPGKSYAVNAGLARARGDIVVLTDDDVLPAPEWVARIVSALEETGADFLAGRVLPLWETAPPGWMSPALHGVLAIPDNGPARRPIALGDSTVVPIGANMALRASVVRRIGGLREDLGKLEGSLRTGEDHEFFLRMLHAGFVGVYEPSAVVHHLVPASRLRPAYFHRWLHQNGRDVARVQAVYAEPVHRLFGIPRYLWREAAASLYAAASATIAGDRRRSMAASVRVSWIAGYVRESWFGARAARRSPLRLAAGQ
jgi:glycosyltransferase involved in cell wall biosynthesis